MKFFCLSGLPRTGSTLLSSILSQNPQIHAEGQSAVCKLMWDMQESFNSKYCQESIIGNNRNTTAHDLISSIPKIYYKNVNKENILDKCSYWMLQDNVEMIRQYIREDPKIIVMTRPVDEIIKSFINLRKMLGWNEEVDGEITQNLNTDQINFTHSSVQYAKNNNNGEYIFVEYEDLVYNTQDVVKNIYEFCEWENFSHNFTNIVNPHPQNDLAWGWPGNILHEVRSEISKRSLL